MKLWKAFGLAGMAGVAATGVIIARDQRRRNDRTPAQVKEQLHQRLAELEAEKAGPLAVEATSAADPKAAGPRARTKLGGLIGSSPPAVVTQAIHAAKTAARSLRR